VHRRSTLRARHAELTRSAILDAARRLFAEQGYAGTAVRPIAEEAGVALQTLYTAFGSKQGLLLALVDTVREQTDSQDLGERMGRSEDPLEMVRLAAHIHRQILERCGDIVATFREGAAGDAEVAAAYEEGQRRTREGVTRLCSRLQTLGALRPELTLERAVDQVAAMFSTEIFEELTGHRSGWTPEEYERWLVERLSEMLLRADRNQSTKLACSYPAKAGATRKPIAL
jgi:AcrR family transcriptional regulator